MRTHHRLGLCHTHLRHIHVKIFTNSPVQIPTSGAQIPTTRPTLLGKTHLRSAFTICTRRRIFSTPSCKKNQPSATDCGDALLLFHSCRPNHSHRLWFNLRATRKRHIENVRRHPLAAQLRRHAPQRHDTIHCQRHDTPHTQRRLLPLQTSSPQPRWWELFTRRHTP